MLQHALTFIWHELKRRPQARTSHPTSVSDPTNAILEQKVKNDQKHVKVGEKAHGGWHIKPR